MQTVLIKNHYYSLSDAAQVDLEEIVAIYNQGVGTANADFHPVAVADKQNWFDAHGPNRPIVVLKDNTKVVAWASLSNLYDRPAYLYSTEISIYVDSAYHGHGLGAYLLQVLTDKARQLGVANVVALIFGHNKASLALFDKFGFEKWGVLPKVCLSLDELADVVILGKKIN